MQSSIVHNFLGGGGNSSFTGKAAVVIAIAHKHMFRFQEQSILTSRAVFANRLPRIGILNGNNDSTGSVGGGVCHNFIFLNNCSGTGLFSPCRRHSTLCL